MKENSTVWCILPIFKKKKKKVSSERFCLSYNKFNTRLHLRKPQDVAYNTFFAGSHRSSMTVHIASFMYKFAFMFAIFFPLKTLVFL